MGYLASIREEIDANYGIKDTSAVANKYWWVPIIGCAIYLCLVWTGKRWMKHKAAYNLRWPLFVWNVVLAAFSTSGAIIMSPPLFADLWEQGFSYTVCNSKIYTTPLLSFFCLLFVFSKLIEFGDTFFVVLRKTPLNFLHWYHHVTVCLVSWHSLAMATAPPHWYCSLNFLVHSVMYSYYMIKSLGVRLPSIVPKTVTTLQLLQFVMGCVVVLWSSWLYGTGMPCHVTILNNSFASGIYFSYLILFGNFFYQRYVVGHKKKSE